MTELTSKYILDRLEAELPPSGVELIYVDYNDKLTDSQLSAYLSGDFTEVWEEISVWESDARYAGYEFYRDEALKTLAHDLKSEGYDPDDVEDAVAEFRYSDEESFFCESVYEREGGDWFDTLARNSPQTYVRIELVDIDDQVHIGDYDPRSDDETWEDMATQLMERITCVEDRAALREALDKVRGELCRGYYYQPFVFGTIYPADLVGNYQEFITLKGGTILIEDPWSGTGMELELDEDKVKLTIPRRELLLDEEARGYGWDEVCGLVQGLYPIEVLDS